MRLYTLSQSLQAAIDAGSPQRVLIEFYEKPDGTPYLDDNDQPTVVAFSNEDILVSNGLQLTSEFNSETDLTIGLCPSAQIRFSMLNDEGQLADFEFGKFKAWLGARLLSPIWGRGAHVKEYVEGGETVYYEFAPLGVFIAHRPDVVRKKIIDVDANDQMILLDEELPTDVTITYPATLYNIAKFLCDTISTETTTVSLKTNSWTNSTISVSAQPEQFTGATMREILGWIAEAACANARFTRDGKLEFAWFNAVNKTYDEHSYTEFTPTWYATKSINRLHIRNADQTDEIKWPAIAPQDEENAYMIQDNPFIRVPESP